MDQQQWHEWRRQGIGASDAPVIMDVCPYKTKAKLLEEKRTGIVQEETDRMRYGKEMEPFALDYFMSETGILLESQKCIEHPEYPWMRATLDGVSEEDNLILEIKSCTKLYNSIPDHHYPQIQHQIEASKNKTGDKKYKKAAYLCAVPIIQNNTVVGIEEARIFYEEVNQEYIKKLIKKESEFYDLMIKEYLDMKDDEAFNMALERYKEIESQKDIFMKAFNEEKTEIIKDLILYSNGSAAEGLIGFLQRVPVKGSVDLVKLKQITGIDANDYRKPDYSRWEIKFKKEVA